MTGTDTNSRAALAALVADTLAYRELPDFVVWAAACDSVQRSIEHAAPEAVA